MMASGAGAAAVAEGVAAALGTLLGTGAGADDALALAAAATGAPSPLPLSHPDAPTSTLSPMTRTLPRMSPDYPIYSGYPSVNPRTVTSTSTTGVSTRNTMNVNPMTSRALRPSMASVGSIQNGCTRFASASPRL